jgi:CMP-N-acetylneuraminic acid synthetase
MNIIAMVPVRKGSKRVPSKNSKPFADTTLLDIRLTMLKQVNGLSDIIVSTDCDRCIEIAESHGVQIHHRDPYYAGEISNDLFYKNLAEACPAEFMINSEVVQPLLKLSTLQAAVDKIKTDYPNIDSVVSVSPEKKFLWQDGKSLNYDSNKTPRSQELPNIVSLNWAVGIIKTELFAATGNIVGNKPYFTVLSKIESIDIDDEEDFMVAELLYKKLGMDWVLQ